MEQPRGKSSHDFEETAGIEFRSLHEVLEVDGQESQKETTRRLVETDDGHNQSPPKDQLEILDLLINANRGIEGGHGRFMPIKPRMYLGERKSLALNRGVHENICGIPQDQWTIYATNFLDGVVPFGSGSLRESGGNRRGYGLGGGEF